jgi:hypothetical protein
MPEQNTAVPHAEQDEAIMLLGLTRYLQRKSWWHFEQEGIEYFHDKINSDNWELFKTTFDELIEQRCDPKILASTVYCFYRMYGKPDNSHRRGFFLSKREIKRHLDVLQNAYEIFDDLDSLIQLPEISATAARRDGQQRRECVREELQFAIRAFEHLRTLRRDILRSYATIPCCIYLKSATGRCQYPLVSTLFECLGYRPNPNRRKQARDLGKGYDPCYQSLERNVSNFKHARQFLCKRLEADLVGEYSSLERLREEQLNEQAQSMRFSSIEISLPGTDKAFVMDYFPDYATAKVWIIKEPAIAEHSPRI